MSSLVPETELKQRVRRVMASATSLGDVPTSLWNDVFQAQRHALPAYAAVSKVGPIERPQDIPPLPITAFKLADLSWGSAGELSHTFLSSGTTRGRDQRSKHVVLDLAMAEASVSRAWQLSPLAELDWDQALILVPSPAEVPESSLVYMIRTWLNQYLAGRPAVWALSQGMLQLDAIQDLLRTGQSTLVLSITSAALALADSGLDGRAIVSLMDTGGIKGQHKPPPRRELLSRYEQGLGLAPDQVINEYGMTELLSQAFAVGEGWLQPVPWLWVGVRHPQTLELLPPGETGLISLVDLANLQSVSALLTEDLGLVNEAGQFQILGRAEGSDLRGCSLLLEQVPR